MSIRYNNMDFNVTDNGDGTFTLAPVAAATQAELLAAYRAARGEVRRAVAYRQKLQAKVAEKVAEIVILRAKRDDLNLLLVAAGVEPDSDLEPETP